MYSSNSQAICLAASRKEDYPNFFEDIAGCAFFGTPFNGADAAAHASLLAYFGEKVGAAEYSKLLNLMKPNNEQLTELRKDFMDMVFKLSPSIKLFSFYEHNPTEVSSLSGLPAFIRSLNPPLPKSIANFVTEQSAVLDGMDSMGLAANHRDLVKFDGSKDERYALVRGPLKTLIKDAHRLVKNRRHATRNVDQGLVNKVLDTLDGAQVSRKRRAIAETVAPSSWVSDESQYISWLAKFDDSHSAIVPKQGDCLWIRGPDGRGKTSATLAALDGIGTMQEQEKSSSSTVLLAYFFCDHTSDYDTAEELLKSLVRQLIKQRNVLAPHARFLLRKKGDSKGQAQLTVQNMWQVLQDILADEDLADNRIYFVINNLEALPGDADSTDTFLDLLYAELEQMDSGRRSIVRWMVTSSYPIDRQVRSDCVRVIDLEDERYGDQVQRELRRHAYDKVSKFVQQRQYSKALAYYASSLIGRRAQNTQWIDITIVQLEQFPPEEDDLRIRLHLEIVPEQLDRLLTSAWERVFTYNGNDELGIKAILRVLVLTYEDPTEDELALLTDLWQTETKRLWLRALIDQCKPLVKVTWKESDGLKRMKIGFEQPFVKKHLYDHAKILLGLREEDIRLHHGMLAFRAFSHIVERFSVPIFLDDDAAYFNNQQYGPGQDVGDQDGQYDDGQISYQQDGTVDDGYSQHQDMEEPGPPENFGNGNQPPQINGVDTDRNVTYGMANEVEQEADDDDDESESESDGDDSEPKPSYRSRKKREDREAEILRDEIRALPYAVKHWLSHASQATDEIAEDLVMERAFWEKNSDIRRRWLIEHTRLVGPNDSFKYTDPSQLTGLHVAGGIGFRHLIVALMETDNKDEINMSDSYSNTPVR